MARDVVRITGKIELNVFSYWHVVNIPSTSTSTRLAEDAGATEKGLTNLGSVQVKFFYLENERNRIGRRDVFICFFFCSIRYGSVIFLLTCIKQLSAHYGPSESCAFIALKYWFHIIWKTFGDYIWVTGDIRLKRNLDKITNHTQDTESDVSFCGAATETSNDLNLYCMDCWQVLRIRIAYTTFHWLIVGGICVCSGGLATHMWFLRFQLYRKIPRRPTNILLWALRLQCSRIWLLTVKKLFGNCHLSTTENGKHMCCHQNILQTKTLHRTDPRLSRNAMQFTQQCVCWFFSLSFDRNHKTTKMKEGRLRLPTPNTSSPYTECDFNRCADR